MEDRLRTLRIEDFEPHVGTAFTLRGAGHEVATVLDHVRPLGGQTVPDAVRRPFALLFGGEGKAVLPQQIVTLTHGSLGTLEIFVVPVGPDPKGRMQYEAIFA